MAMLPIKPDLSVAGKYWSQHGLLFGTEENPYLYLANGSRVYGVPNDFARRYNRLVAAADEAGIEALLAASKIDAPVFINDNPVQPFPVHAISLAIAQKCNLGCTYCYAQQGQFGGAAKAMSEEVALRAIEQLIDGVEKGEKVNIAFLGGEPLINRPVLRAATDFAETRASASGVDVGFSITTNGTLLNSDDGAFLERHHFAVTISLDGVGNIHDQQRSYKGGRGSYQRIIENVAPLLKMQKHMQVSARVTVTPRNLHLLETLDHFVALGFHSVGFSPMLSSPDGADQMDGSALTTFLEQMIECGRAFEAHLIAGRRYPFLNMITALKEIHKGTHRPYPCGAGAGYLGVSADGGYFACHRFVDDGVGAMGDLDTGVDASAQSDWLSRRHVHFQSPCSECWARYLCGGGCHHEVIHRGRPACDYIRGWLTYCLEAYARLLGIVPEFFHGTPAPEGIAPSPRPEVRN